MHSHVVVWHPESCTGTCLPVLTWCAFYHFLWFIFFIAIGITLQESTHSLELCSPIYHTFVTGFTGWMQESESLSSVPAAKSVQQQEFIPSTPPVFEQRLFPRTGKLGDMPGDLTQHWSIGASTKPDLATWPEEVVVSVLLVFSHMPAASTFPENLCCHISASLCEVLMYFGGGKYPALLAHPGELPRCCFQLNIQYPVYCSWSFLS